MGALGNGGLVGNYSDMRGTYAEHIQTWLDSCLLVDISISAAQELFSTVSINVGEDTLEYQFAALRAAMSGGHEFTFADGKPANGWILMFMEWEHI